MYSSNSLALMPTLKGGINSQKKKKKVKQVNAQLPNDCFSHTFVYLHELSKALQKLNA